MRFYKEQDTHIKFYNTSAKKSSSNNRTRFKNLTGCIKETNRRTNKMKKWSKKTIKRTRNINYFRAWALAIKQNNVTSYQVLKKTSYHHLKDYKGFPRRRVWTVTRAGKERPLGILTIYDRVIQEMFRRVLSPPMDLVLRLRKRKPSHQVLWLLAQRIQKTTISYFYSPSVGGVFEAVHSRWILNNFPMPDKCNLVLKGWLTSRGFLGDIRYPQPKNQIFREGILSYLIVNFTLNGLEQFLDRGILRRVAKTPACVDRKRCFRILSVVVKDTNKWVILRSTSLRFKLYYQNAKKFLRTRGLTLSDKKAKTIAWKNSSKVVTFKCLGSMLFGSTPLPRFNKKIRRDSSKDNNTIVPTPVIKQPRSLLEATKMHFYLKR